MKLKEYLNKLIEKKNLTEEEAEELLLEIMEGSVSPAVPASILTALRMKGETTEEITGFIKAVRKKMIPVTSNAIDVCGTGGDGTGTFNISTTVAFIVAGAGVKVAKHGNVSISSKCGSADVLKELGVNINLNSLQAQKILNKAGMVFLFAQNFHPCYKNIAGIRKELGFRTIFNYLGPFTNPACVKRQLIGVSNLGAAGKLARVSRNLGYDKLIICTSSDGMDEVSIFAETFIFEVEKESLKKYVFNPKDCGINSVDKKEILGGNSKRNAQILTDILQGKKSSARTIAIVNSAFALYVASIAKNIKEGMKIAEKSIDSGNALNVLVNLKKESAQYA